MTKYRCEGCAVDIPCEALIPDEPLVGIPDSCLYGGGIKVWHEIEEPGYKGDYLEDMYEGIKIGKAELEPRLESEEEKS